MMDRTTSDVLFEYGKVGILIDDAPLAVNRIARELYAADELPAWWIHARTLEAGKKLLQDLESSPADESAVVVVIDRLVPPRDQEVACYWEQEDDEVCREFRRLIKHAGVRSSRTTVIPITSYPRRDATGIEVMAWNPRFHEPVFQLRTQIRRSFNHVNALASLLKYAPEPTAPAADSDDDPSNLRKLKAKHCARVAGARIAEICGHLRDTSWEVVLLTGAGMSVTQDTERAGMPWNDWLLTEAAHGTLAWLAHAPMQPPMFVEARTGTTPSPLPFQPYPGNAISAQPVIPGDGVIPEILRQYASKQRVCLADLPVQVEGFNSIFSDSPGTMELQFRRNFQRAVMRYDEGICYQHWLAARLPFDLIVSTNFDGFHERAAAHCAARAGSYSEPRTQEAKIIKPYGTAAQRSKIAFSPGEFQDGIQSISDDLLEALGPEIVDGRPRPRTKNLHLIIVGYSCKDDVIPITLGPLLSKRPAAQITWVDLRSFEVMNAFDPNANTVQTFVYRQLFFDKNQCRVEALPLRAIDFFYDLWQLYWETIHPTRELQR